MAVTHAEHRRRQKERKEAHGKQCADCQYCAPDHRRLGPGWIEMDNNGPISPCPVCNPRGDYRRSR